MFYFIKEFKRWAKRTKSGAGFIPLGKIESSYLLRLPAMFGLMHKGVIFLINGILFSVRRRRSFRFSQTGFTLIEMIVSIGVFAIAMLISVGAILSISGAQKRAIAIQNVQDNIRFALETMTKEARIGSSYHCGLGINEILITPRDCANGGPSFTFVNARGETVSYQFIAKTCPTCTDGRIERYNSSQGQFFRTTSTNVNIERLRFYVLGSAPGDNAQPRVIIIARGTAMVKGQTVLLDLETTVSSRLLDS